MSEGDAASKTPWTKPRPNIDHDNAPFWDGLRRHKFLLWRCRTCGASYWPKAYCRNHDNEPFAANMEWAETTGRVKNLRHPREKSAVEESLSVPTFTMRGQVTLATPGS